MKLTHFKKRKDLPLTNSQMIKFIQAFKGDFWVRNGDNGIRNYTRRPSKFPEIYSTEEMAHELMSRGFELMNFGNLQTQAHINHDKSAERIARIYQNILKAGDDGLPVVSCRPYLIKNRGAFVLMERYGCLRVTLYKDGVRSRRYIGPYSFDPEIHFEAPEDVNLEGVVRQIKGAGARGLSRRDLVMLSRWFRTLDDMAVEDFHRKLIKDGRVTTTKRTGRGGGNMVYVSTRAVDLDSII